MVKIIKKTFNFQSLFGKNGFGKTNFGTNSPKFYNASIDNTPEIFYIIDITTPAQTIHKDLSSIDIEYTTLNIENFNVYYKINFGEYNFIENINYNESPYTLDLSSIVLNDNDLLIIKFENDLTSDNVTFTCEQPYITITSLSGDVDVDSIINITYDWNDVDLIDVYYQINGGSEIVYEENVIPSGIYNFDTESIEFLHGDILTVIFKDSDDLSVNDNVSYTIIVSEIIN